VLAFLLGGDLKWMKVPIVSLDDFVETMAIISTILYERNDGNPVPAIFNTKGVNDLGQLAPFFSVSEIALG